MDGSSAGISLHLLLALSSLSCCSSAAYQWPHHFRPLHHSLVPSPHHPSSLKISQLADRRPNHSSLYTCKKSPCPLRHSRPRHRPRYPQEEAAWPAASKRVFPRETQTPETIRRLNTNTPPEKSTRRPQHSPCSVTVLAPTLPPLPRGTSRLTAACLSPITDSSPAPTVIMLSLELLVSGAVALTAPERQTSESSPTSPSRCVEQSSRSSSADRVRWTRRRNKKKHKSSSLYSPERRVDLGASSGGSVVAMPFTEVA